LASVVGWALLFLAASRRLDLWAPFAHGTRTENAATVLITLLFAAVVVVVARAVTRLAARSIASPLWVYKLQANRVAGNMGKVRRSPAFMLINSRFDEAYRSLSAVQEGPNPLMQAAPAAGSFSSQLAAVADSGLRRLSQLVGRTLDTRRVGALTLVGAVPIAALLVWQWQLPALTAIAPSDSVAVCFWVLATAIALAASVFDRFLFLPGIILVESVGAIWKAITGFAALRFALRLRREVWGFTQSLLLGLSGAAQRVEDVRVSATFGSSDPEDSIYLELPEDIVMEVIRSQNARLAETRDILYREGGTWSPVSLRKDLEAIDFPLVHTTYYRQQACIEKVADWLCEPVVEEFDGRAKQAVTVLNHGGDGGVHEGFIDEIELVNGYRKHVKDLQERHCGPTSAWSVPPRQSAAAARAQFLRELSPLNGGAPRHPF